MEDAISGFCRMINVCHVFYIMIKGLHDGIVMMFVFFVGFLLQWFLEVVFGWLEGLGQGNVLGYDRLGLG